MRVEFTEIDLPALNGPANVLVFHNPDTNAQFVVKVLRTETAPVINSFLRRGMALISNEMTPR